MLDFLNNMYVVEICFRKINDICIYMCSEYTFLIVICVSLYGLESLYDFLLV